MKKDMDPERFTTPLIKICGLTDVREAAFLNAAGADYAGFVFYPPSKRYVTLENAREIASGLTDRIKRVAVLVSPSASDIDRIQESGFIDIIQIHKELSTEVLKISKLPVWRALNLSSLSGSGETDRPVISALSQLPEEYRHKIEAVLVDAPDFGSGKTFDWGEGRIAGVDEQISPESGGTEGKGVSFILAGGLNAANVAEGIRLFKPDIVDVSSGVEGEHGKDENLINEFVKAVRNTAAGKGI